MTPNFDEIEFGSVRAVPQRTGSDQSSADRRSSRPVGRKSKVENRKEKRKEKRKKVGPKKASKKRTQAKNRARDKKADKKKAPQSSSKRRDNLLVNDASPDTVLVPLDQWSLVLKQLGNLHEAGQQLADARERAAKAETEATFLRERVRALRRELAERPSPPTNPPATD